MKKIKFKIKISDELTKLKNFFIDKFKKFIKFTKFIKFKIIKSFNNYFIDQLNKFTKFIHLINFQKLDTLLQQKL